MSGRIFARYVVQVGDHSPEVAPNKRLAIRRCKALVTAAAHGTKGSVESGAAGGPLLWQAHNEHGRVVVEEL